MSYKGVYIAFGVLLFMLPGCKIKEWLSCATGNKDTCCLSMSTQNRSESIASAPGANPYVPSDDKTPVLAAMDGLPVVTQGQLDAMIEANPQLQQMKSMIDPVQLYYQLLQGLINKVVLCEFVRINKLDQASDYKKKLAEMVDSVTNMLNVEIFSQSLPVSIKESDVKEFYENNKDKIPELMVSRGGVQAACVHFDKENEAQEFLKKIDQENGDIKKAAEQAGLIGKFKDFMLINSQSFGYDPVLRSKVLSMKNVPGSDLCKINDGSVYVITASSKEEPTYKPFETIKKQLREYLESEERKKIAMTELVKLAEKYKISRTKAGEDITKKVEQSLPVNNAPGALESPEDND